jgi:hypothetical protein
MPDHQPINTSFVLIDQAAKGTKEVTPSGIEINLAPGGTDIANKTSFTDFEEVNGELVPTKPMGGEYDPSGAYQHALHWDETGWLLSHVVGDPVTTGASDPYTHTMTLGTANPPKSWLQLEKRQSDATTNKCRMFWDGRIGRIGMNVGKTGGVLFDVNFSFCEVEAWSSSYEVASPTEYGSDPVDIRDTAVLKVDASAVTNFESFSWFLDWRLDEGRPVCNGGKRSKLVRLKPMVGGSFTCFLDDDSAAYVKDKAEGGTEVALDLELTTTAVTRELLFDWNNVILQMTSAEIRGGGLNRVSFDWRSYGASAMVATLYNDVASY